MRYNAIFILFTFVFVMFLNIGNGISAVIGSGLPGDIDGDGVVNISEVQNSINSFLGLNAAEADVSTVLPGTWYVTNYENSTSGYCYMNPCSQGISMGTITFGTDGTYSLDSGNCLLTLYGTDTPGGWVIYQGNILQMQYKSTAKYSLPLSYNKNMIIFEKSGNVVVLSKTAQNLPPTAVVSSMNPSNNIGSDWTLDGSSSSDPNNDKLTYRWSIISKPEHSQSILSNTTAVKPSITPDLAGSYVFSLTVSDGKLSSVASSVTFTALKPDPSAPSKPNGLTVTKSTSNSVSLSWNASTGGSGGVAYYTIYRNNSLVGSSIKTTYIDTNTDNSRDYLIPSADYLYTVTATSVGQTTSANSAQVIATTLSLSSMLSKFTPIIVFNTVTGVIGRQGLASTELMSKAREEYSGHDVIVHQSVDANKYKIESLGNRTYAIVSYDTGLPMETNIKAPTLTSLNSIPYSYLYVDMKTGKTSQGGSGSQGGFCLSYVTDSLGVYIPGEIL